MHSTSFQRQFLELFGVTENQSIQIAHGDQISTDFYSHAGVDIEAGDALSKAAGKIARGSSDNCPFIIVDSYSEGQFRGPKSFTTRNVPEGTFHTLAPDGIGTKMILIDSVENYTHAAHDVVSMTSDDIARHGGVPTVFTNIFDVSRITSENLTYLTQIIEGLGTLAKDQNFVILNGETAELGSCVGSTNATAKTSINWSGVMHGLFHPDKIVTGEDMEDGDIIIALRQKGFRSNGISAVRRAFHLEYGENWYSRAPKSELLEAATPSVAYAKLIATANGWYNQENDFVPLVEMTGISHLSGGSFQGKVLEDLLAPSKLSAHFNNLYPIPQIVQKCALWSQKGSNPISSMEELYSTWCCGQGMLVVVRSLRDARKFSELAESMNIGSQICGRIEASKYGKSTMTFSNIELA